MSKTIRRVSQAPESLLSIEESTTGVTLPHRTTSICPECNRILTALVFERDDQIWMSKECKEHGFFEDLYFGSLDMYNKFSKYVHNGKGIENPNVPLETCACPTNCGLCSSHLSHTGLANIVVTNRCDLTCWYCFFYAERMGYIYEPTADQIRRMVSNLRAERPVPGNAIQVTGGEPTLREDIVELVKAMKEGGVDHIQLNTNGIKISEDPDLMRQLREAGVNTLYLSFDGVTKRTNPKNHWEIPGVLKNCRATDMSITLVPTVIRTVNDHELGGMIRFAQQNIDVVRAVNFQPVSLTGRMPSRERMRYRITIPDCIERIEEQTDGEITTDAWFPVPSCTPITHFAEALTNRPEFELSIHFVCGAGTYVFKEGDRLVPMADFVDVEGVLKYLDEKADEIERGKNKYWVSLKVMANLGRFIDKGRQPEGINMIRLLFEALVRHNYDALGKFHKKSLFLGMMHFMDKYNHDEERLRRCDIHYLTPDDRIVPFCAFNVIPEWYRDKIQREYGITIEEWEERTGRLLKEGYYKRDIKELRSLPMYEETYGGGCAPVPGRDRPESLQSKYSA